MRRWKAAPIVILALLCWSCGLGAEDEGKEQELEENSPQTSPSRSDQGQEGRERAGRTDRDDGVGDQLTQECSAVTQETRTIVNESLKEEEEGDSETIETASKPKRKVRRQATSVGVSKEEREEKKEKEQEKDYVHEEEKNKKEQEKIRVNYVPELSPSITTPGRLYNGSWFIMFYAVWCEFSQAAEPLFLEVIQHMVETNITAQHSVHMGKIDVTKHGEVAKHFKIKSTPTFLFYKRGTRYEFDDEVTVENLKKFMHLILDSGVAWVNTTQQLAAYQRNYSVLFLLVHDREVDSDWHATYTQVADEKVLRGTFLETMEPDVVKHYHITTFPTMLVLKDGGSYRFKDALSSYAVKKWINSERHPAFPTVNKTNIYRYLRQLGGKRLGVLVVDEDPSQRRIAQKKAIEVVRKVTLGRQVHNQFQFILLESVELAKNLLQQSSLELPLLFAFEPWTGYYYIYELGEKEKGITEKSVVTFFKAVSKSKLKPQGGPSFKYTLLYLWWRIYATTQTMITHRPMLSLMAFLSVLGVSLFYLTICCKRPQKKLISRRAARARAMAQQRQQQRTTGSVRRRRRQNHDQADQNHDRDEDDEGTFSEDESRSQSEEESPKDK